MITLEIRIEHSSVPFAGAKTKILDFENHRENLVPAVELLLRESKQLQANWDTGSKSLTAYAATPRTA